MTNEIMAPMENVELYSIIFNIENALRELIIESLNNIEGSHWYRKRLPGDILEKYRKGIQFERSIKWSKLVPHHPMYYIDFPDLRKIIVKDDNWRSVFKEIFGRKEMIDNLLNDIENIRNKVAHNRKATYEEVDNVKILKGKLSECIGEKYYNELSNNCTCLMDIGERLSKLEELCQSSYIECKNCQELGESRNWKAVCNEWWFEETYLDNELEGIVGYFKLMEEYKNLPRRRGSGHIIESWVSNNDVEMKYNKAKENLSMILRWWR